MHDSAPSSHSWALRKTIIESTGATQVLHKPPKYEHGTYSKNPISRFGYLRRKRICQQRGALPKGKRDKVGLLRAELVIKHDPELCCVRFVLVCIVPGSFKQSGKSFDPWDFVLVENIDLCTVICASSVA